MGIENERKILLDTAKSAQLWKDLKAARSTYDVQFMDITQGYLSGSARIRHVVPHEPKPGEANEFHIFTYKTKVSGSTVELETQISVHDYHKLMLIVKPLVLKTRAKIQQDDLTWDIDFFKTPKSGQVYLSMAEVEMPEFQTDVPELYPLLHPYALKWIDQGDKRFNNRNLSNPKKAAKSVAEILNAKTDTK